ncbi:MAG: class B sortase [Clostridia bacterium]|nr:class B sortase [Clostridia bacterium]
MNNDNQKKPSSLPEGLSSIADDEAITEINLTDFLEESSKSSPLFEGFHEDIEATEKSLENELQSLYDDIMSSGPETIVPKPMSVLTATEAEPAKVVLSDPEIPEEPEETNLDSLWMNPEDYFDDDIPVVSLDDSHNGEADSFLDGGISQDAFFDPAPVDELAAMGEEDKAKSDIFSMIDLLKSESSSETGYDDLLTEIETNAGIMPVATELSEASQLVSDTVSYEEDTVGDASEEYEEVVFTDDEIDWDDLEYSDSVPAEAPPAPIFPEINMAEPVIENAEPFSEQTSEEESAFDMELSALPDETDKNEESNEAAHGFVVNVPDDGVDYEKAALVPEKLYEAAPMSTQTLEDDPDLYDGDSDEKKKKSKKEKKNKDEQPEEGKKKVTAGDVVRKIVLSLSIITIIVSCGILINTYFIEPYRFKSDADELVEQMSVNSDEHDKEATVNEQIKSENPETDFPEGMLAKYAQLYAQNNDFAGWITIEGLGINLPIAQGNNNEYYLKRDIYKKYTSYGVPFFDYRMSNLRTLHKNTMVYGHNMRHDDYIFGMLENYRTKEGFAQAPVIECNTIFGDHTWFVYAVFITNSKPSDDNGYFLPYNFIDVSTDKFKDYISEIDKRKLYTTGVDINENDKILTLQACVYDFDGAMIVVVAREKREGESISVDTSKAYDNPNPKYPQKWYDVNKKQNPYAEDSRW